MNATILTTVTITIIIRITIVTIGLSFMQKALANVELLPRKAVGGAPTECAS